MRSLCEAEPYLERFTNQVVITDELREKFEVKIEVEDVEVDERYKNAYVCRFYIEGREEYYLSASIKKQKAKRTGFIFDVRKGKGEAHEYFQEFGPENIQMAIIEEFSCRNDTELKIKENELILAQAKSPLSLRKYPSRISTKSKNRYHASKIYLMWHPDCDQIYIASTVKSLAEKKSAHIMQSRTQDSVLYTFAESYGGIENFRISLLENWSCNCVADLEMRQRFWQNVFPITLQIGAELPLDRQISIYNSIQEFLLDTILELRQFAELVNVNETNERNYRNRIVVEDYEVDERYANAYIYKLFVDGHDKFYYGSSIKEPMEKRAAHVYDAKRGAQGKAYDFFRSVGSEKIKLEVVQRVDCSNETQLKIQENEYIKRYLDDPKCLNHFMALTKTPKNNRYEEGKIYIIHKENCSLIYLGSTIQSLEERKKNHDTYRKEGESALCKLARKYGGITSFNISLWENWPCNSRRQLEEREQFWKDCFPEEVLFNQNNALTTPEVKKEKRKQSNEALRKTEAYKARVRARKNNETEEHKQARLAKARTRPVTKETRDRQSEYKKARRLEEDAQTRETRLEKLRVDGKVRYENSKDIKNMKRMVVRLNSSEDYSPTEASLQKYQIYQKADGQYTSNLHDEQESCVSSRG